MHYPETIVMADRGFENSDLPLHVHVRLFWTLIEAGVREAHLASCFGALSSVLESLYSGGDETARPASF
jgi:hypothetical protein